MSDWFHSLPVTWMALLVFGFTYFVVAVIYAVVRLSAVGERARAFKSVSPGMLPPLGIVFGLFVGFTAGRRRRRRHPALTAQIALRFGNSPNFGG